MQKKTKQNKIPEGELEGELEDELGEELRENLRRTLKIRRENFENPEGEL